MTTTIKSRFPIERIYLHYIFFTLRFCIGSPIMVVYRRKLVAMLEKIEEISGCVRTRKEVFYMFSTKNGMFSIKRVKN